MKLDSLGTRAEIEARTERHRRHPHPAGSPVGPEGVELLRATTDEAVELASALGDREMREELTARAV